MPFATIVGALSAISSSLKIVEFVETHGLPGPEVLTLGLQPAELQSVQRAAQSLEGVIGDAYDGLLRGTNDRIAKCIERLNDALNDPSFLPQERRGFGKAARSCICREISMIKDLNAGSLPPDLENLWGQHVCDGVSA